MTILAEKNYYLNFLCNHITEKSGIGFDKRKRQQLAQIAKSRCEALGLDHIRGYYALLRAPADKGKEFNTLMDILTIQESSFFRHKAQFDVLRQFCLPLLMKKKKGENSRINIWSAGCAGGEEAYSIAMLVRDLIPEKPKTKVLIKGTDISQRALSKAKKGVYTERAVRGLAPYYLNHYFSRQGDGYVLSPKIKAMVAFECLNLSEEPFPIKSMPVWDLIFCRNVIIYFTSDHRRKLITNFYSALADGGYLFAGFSETMRYLNEYFVPIQMEGAFIYQKPFPGQGPKPAYVHSQKVLKKRHAALDLKERRPLFRGQKKKPGPSNIDTGQITIQKAQFQNNKAPILPDKTEKTIFPGSKEVATEKTKSIDARLSLAGQLADNGETMDAVAHLDDIIRQDPLHAQAYFMLAMIYRNAGSPDQAVHYLKKVIYLEPENPVARLHLADVFEEASQKTDACREYANVISLLETRKNLEREIFGDGFTGEAILTAARAHLKLIEQTTSR